MQDVFRIAISESGSLSFVANIWIVLIVGGLLIVAAMIWRWIRDLIFQRNFEIDEIELGIAGGKVKIKPNHEDLQIAYKLWVELTTRKLGLPFDEDHDVIDEVYNSWYEFFKITRELMKNLPVDKIRGSESTQLLVSISIGVLNQAIRPHLTKWQARYRHWLDVELAKQEGKDTPPQLLQQKYPKYKELVTELKATNAQLVAYARKLAEILELSERAVQKAAQG